MAVVNQDEEYQENLRTAMKNMADTLEHTLAMFTKHQEPEARVALANYVIGYLGVSYGLKYG